MIILKNGLKNILSESLSVEQRGLLITAMLCKDSNSKLTLAKFKCYVKTKDYKEDLIHLQDNGFIKWSGYNSAKKSLEEKEIDPKLVEITEFMKSLYGVTAWGIETAIWKNLKARMGEYDVDDIKLVISNRWEEWKDNAEMSKNLNPITIFRPSLFEKYLSDAQKTGVGKGIISTSKLDLKDGDVITYEHTKEFVKNDLYKYKVFRKDGSGNAIGNGKIEQKMGKDLKILLNIENNIEKNGGVGQFIYIFVKK